MAILVPRETIYRALFDLMGATKINGDPAFVYTSRKLRTTDDITSLRQPALLMSQMSQIVIRKERGMPPIHEWPVTFFMLFRPGDLMTPVADDEEQYADTIINNYLDAFENQLEPAVLAHASNGCQTLGGLVKDVRMEGVVVTNNGLLDNQAVVEIPVKILATR